jgi:hypothetical protein
MIPSEDPDYGDLGQAFPAWTGAAKDAILQPPKPEITPSPQILQRVMDRDADWEAADLTAAGCMPKAGIVRNDSCRHYERRQTSVLRITQVRVRRRTPPS